MKANGMRSGTGRHIEEWANPRAVIFLTLLFLGTLWSLVVFSAIATRQESIDATGDRLQRMNHAVEEETRRYVDLVAVFLAACEQSLAANPAHDPRSDTVLRNLVEGFRARTGGAIDIRLVARDGSLVDVVETPATPLANVADSDYVRGALAGPGLFIGHPVQSPLTGRHGLPVALRLRQPAHGIHILLAVIDLPTLQDTYEEQRQKPGGTIALLRRDGTVLASAPDDEGLPGQSIADGKLFREHLAQEPRGVVLVEETTGRQAREFTSYSSMPDLPLVITVSENYDAALAPWLQHTLWIVLLALGVTVPTAVVAYRSLRLLRALASRDAQLHRMSTTDGLTDASSRQHFVDELAEQRESARRQASALTVLLFNIDFFQRINDGYGHAVGDQVLVAFARVARGCLRERDLLGRLGAGEFAILLPGTAVEEAVLVAERVRRETAEIAIATENGTVKFTASAGLTAAHTADSSVDDLLKRAAKALHDARTGGHDRVVVA